MKLAVIFESSPYDRKGLFNAVHNRIRHLIQAGEFEVDVYCVHARDNAFTRRIRHTPVTPDTGSVTIDGIIYRLMWYRFSVLDHFLVEKFHKRPVLFKKFMDKTVRLLEGYDAVIAHSFTGGLLACRAHTDYGIPYYVTWHGSDVHTHPWRVPVILEDTRIIMENAACNFFVSKALMDLSDKISLNAPKEVLYNGVSSRFRKMDGAEVAGLRSGYGLSEGEKVVAFAGTLAAVKNVRTLAPLFARISSLYQDPLEFWIVGDGKLRCLVEKDMKESGCNTRFWGNVSADEMPSIMNCVDVLVLPSINEGLPLVCAEALRCGANAVGSAVGGIHEVIGDENVFPLGDSFVDSMAERVVQMLRSDVVQQLPDEMDWKMTASKEYAFLRKLEALGKS